MSFSLDHGRSLYIEKWVFFRDSRPTSEHAMLIFSFKTYGTLTPPAHLTALAKERGYLVDADRLTGTTKLLDAHSGLEVEFLIGKKGQGLESVLKTNIGVAAQALRHLDILARNRIEVICLGHRVNVPCPEAYAVHKMTVNAERGQKSEKDARAVLGIWPFLNKAKVETLLDGLTKRERLRANEFMQTHQLEI